MDPTMPVSSTNHVAQLAPLRPHQRYACDFVLDHPFCGLFLPLGTGKSLTTLEALYELNPTCHVLIIGPKPVIQATWIDEIEKWGYPFRTKSLANDERGRKLDKKKRLERYQEVFTDPPTVYFINRELVADLVDNMPKKGKTKLWPFPYVIIDEAQAFKNGQSKRFRALKSVRPAISRLIELTGTPTPNGLMDLWALIYLLDQGMRLGNTITKYRDAFFNARPLENSRGVIYTLRSGADQIIHRLVSDIVMSLDDLSQSLPPVTYDDRIIALSERERKLYDKFAQTAVLEFVDGDMTIAANRAVLQMRLSQIASGTCYVNETHEYQVIHERKLEETLRIIESAGSPVLIAYRFQSDKEELMKYLTQAGIDVQAFDGSREMVAKWNARKIQAMLVQPASAGAGLNLQQGGHTLVWYSVPWNLEHYLQTNKRLDRPGQTEPVFIYHLLADVGVEQDVMNAIQKKERVENALLDYVTHTVPPERIAQGQAAIADGKD